MKKSAWAARVMRMTPSAPTPRWRSQIAATSAGSRGRRSSRSSITTKSLPVPWTFENRSSSIGQILQHLVDDRARTPRAGAEPAHPRVLPEPRALPSRERPGASFRGGDRLVERAPTREMSRPRTVPDGLIGGEPFPQPASHERLHLLEEPADEHLPNPGRDPFVERLAVEVDAGDAGPLRRIVVPRDSVGGERSPGDGGHL